MRIIIGKNTEKYMEVFGLTYPFTEEQLKSVYREAAKRYHPDHNPGSDGKKFLFIKEAFESLFPLCVNLAKEKAEHLKRLAKEDGDIFNLTKTCHVCGGRGIMPAKKIYCPVCAYFPSLWDIFSPFGTPGYIWRRCSDCRGTGIFTLRSGRKVECRKCKGAGRISMKCSRCNGKGIIEHESYPCDFCSGTGREALDLFNPVIPRGAVL